MGLPSVAFTNPFIGKAMGVHPNGDGTFTYQGRIIDQHSNVWDPGTGKWYNQNGQEWLGTNVGNNTGIFADTPTVRGNDGKIYGGSGSSNGLDLSSFLGAGGGGSGGGSGPDHFFDITPYQQGQLDIQNKQLTLDQNAFDWKKQFDTMTLNYNTLKADRDNAIAIGDLELAKQKQASMDYWQQQGNQLAASTSNAGNATQIAQAQIAANRFLQDTKINDDTNRAIAGQQGQIAGYNAATTRGKDMGQLALDNNKFILDKSTSPRDLFGLYMMQRGVTPDWGSLTNGGAPVMGDPLRVKDPFSFLDTSQKLPSNYTLAPGAAYNNNQALATPGQNGVVAIPQVTAGTGGPPQGYNDINPGGLMGGVPSAGLRPGMNLSTYGGKDPGSGSMFDTGTAYYDFGRTRPIGQNDVISPGSQVWVDYGGKPKTSSQGPNPFGLNTGPNSLLSGMKPEPIGNPTPVSSGGPTQFKQERFSAGTADFGYTTAPHIMAGDAPTSNPWGGGARPELIENPTHAPLRIQNTWQTAADYGGPRRFADGTDRPTKSFADMLAKLMVERIFNVGGDMSYGKPQIGQAAGYDMSGSLGDVGALMGNAGGMVRQPDSPGNFDPKWAQDAMGVNPHYPADPTVDGPPWVPDFPVKVPMPATEFGGFNPNHPLDTSQIEDMRRYALGTDPVSSGATAMNYQSAGMGDQYLQSSSNPGLDRAMLPRNMQTLYDYGMPLSPSLVNGTTGGRIGNADVASAFRQRGGGVLTSLQGYNNMTPGEAELYQGYAQGVTGVPWADIADYLGRPTQNLGTARRAGSAGF